MSDDDKEEEDKPNVWVVDLMFRSDYRAQDAFFFKTEEEAREFYRELNKDWGEPYGEPGFVAVGIYCIQQYFTVEEALDRYVSCYICDEPVSAQCGCKE